MSYKKLLILIFLLSFVGTIISLFAQYKLGLIPCNLCILQRIIIIYIATISFIFIIFITFSNKFLIKLIYIVLSSIPTIFGLFVAIKHILILNQPKENLATCSPNLTFLFKTLPFNKFYKTLITGTSDCTIAQKLFFLPIPVWSSILFTLIFILIILLLLKIKD